MMKRFFIIVAIVIGFQQLFSQTANSVQNGNFYMPTTWDCNCIPLPGYTVNIGHDVVLDNDFVLNGGNINIGTNGVLRENTPGRYLVMNSGSVLNNGKLKMSRVGFYGGDFTNNDSCLIYSVFFSGADVWNTGSITGVDSLFIQSYFYNDADGLVDAFRVTVNDTLENDGVFNATELLNLDIFLNYNEANFHNFFSNEFTENDYLITFNDFTNRGEFWNYGDMEGVADFMNVGYFYNDTIGTVTLGNDFSNVDSVNHMAYFEINGGFYAEGNFFNRDTIYGDIGHICVKNASTNAGKMLGTFDFCDLTGSGTPDFNTGTISNGITYCQNSCAEAINEINNSHIEMVVYPNPSNNKVFFEFSGEIKNASLTITDIQGRVIIYKTGNFSDKFVFDKGNIPSGLYIYRFTSDSKQITGKLVIE
ncbi:MAG: T9SS type A sorting domain-containing protein [Bacteroidota bacterium]